MLFGIKVQIWDQITLVQLECCYTVRWMLSSVHWLTPQEQGELSPLLPAHLLVEWPVPLLAQGPAVSTHNRLDSSRYVWPYEVCILFTSRSDSGRRWRTPWAPARAWRRGRVCTRSRCGSRPPPPPAARRCRSSGGSGSPHTAMGKLMMLDFVLWNCLLFVWLRTKRQNASLYPPQLHWSYEYKINWFAIDPNCWFETWSIQTFLHAVIL